MLPEDIKRLERERAIAEAVRGPDYREYEMSVRAVKSEHGKRAAAQRESDARHEWAYYRLMSHIQITTNEHEQRKRIRARRSYGPEM